MIIRDSLAEKSAVIMITKIIIIELKE